MANRLYDTDETPLPARNFRIAVYYGAATATLSAFLLMWWPWGALLGWPVVSLAIATLAYCGLGARIYRKRAGVLPWSTRVLLAPLLLGQQLSLLYYRRQCRAWDEAAPNVLIGRKLNGAEAADAIRSGVTAVLDLTAEFSEAAPLREITYYNIPILDLTAPTMAQMTKAVAFITERAARGKVYVHCKIGYSRSAAIVGAYLLASGHAATTDNACKMLRKVRPTIVIRPEALHALRAFEQHLR